MGYITQILLICVCINIISVYGNTRTRTVRPIQRSRISGLLSRHRHLRFNPVFRARLRRRGLTLARRFQSLSNRISALRGLASGSNRLTSSRRRGSALNTGTTANLIARLRHPLLCGRGKVLICGEAKNGITIQRCYSNCGSRSCVVPCVCTCFDLPKTGSLRPAGGQVFLPLAEGARLPECRRKEILRCTAKRRTIATNRQCSSACMAGVCPSTCNCFCIDERLKGQGLDSNSLSGSTNTISGKSLGLDTKSSIGGLAGNVGGGPIIVEKSPSSGGSAGAATETETIDVKIDVVKGGDTGKKTDKNVNNKGLGNGILDPNLGIDLGAASLGGNALGGNALGGNALDVNALGGIALGGNALGSNALDVNALGGNALGGNALGSNALDINALGGNALGGNALGGNALGGNALGGPLDGIGGIPGVNALRNNDPLVLLDPTRQDQTVGKIPFNPNDPMAPSGLSPGSNPAGNAPGGEFLSQALQNLGGSVDLLDPSLANMLPMALGQGGIDAAAVGGGGTGLNAMGQNMVGSNDISGFNTGAVSDVGGVSVGAINDAINAAGVNSISGLDSTGLKGMPLDPGLANGMGGLDVSGMQIAAGIDPGVTKSASGNAIDSMAANIVSGTNTGGPNDLWGAQGGSAGQPTGRLNDAWGSTSGTAGKAVSINSGGLNDAWGSTSGTAGKAVSTNSGGLDGAWGGNSGTGSSNKKVSVNVNVSGSGPPPAITTGQNNDYCSQTGRRMWCKAGVTWESTPGLTRWCNVNCPSGACDVERCLCNCVTPQEYELNFNKFIGFK